MPPRGNASDVVRLVRGVRGRVKMRMELVIRFGFGTDIPWVKRNEDGSALLAICRAGHDGAAHAGRDPRRGYDHGGRFRGQRRRNRSPSCSPTALRICRCPSRSIRRRRCRTPKISGPNGAAIAPMRATTRSRDAVADHAEGADLRADRRHCRGAHDLAAGKARRRSETGTTAFAGCATPPSRCWR